ncbi:hypothetical protein DRO61_10595 [Candidatus Bathyarchaeota archaeon]|jgi:hypothetical protein|nr:MAG: hypothetical protein DRO61_10595 [Candidatus Bathyarchaeota archaeon]
MGRRIEREVIEMKKLYLIPLVLCLFLCGPSCKRGQEEPVTKVEEKVEEASQAPITEESEPMIEEGEQKMDEAVEPEVPALEESEEKE